MSRIARKPLELPDGVSVKVDSRSVELKGAKGTLQVRMLKYIEVELKGKQISLSRSSHLTQAKANHGTLYRLINNAIIGVNKGYTRVLELRGLGYSAELKGQDLFLNIGYAHPVDVKLPDGFKGTLTKTKDLQTKVDLFVFTVEGIDKQKLHQFCAEVKKLRPIDPYNLSGIKYGHEVVQKKERRAQGAVAGK